MNMIASKSMPTIPNNPSIFGSIIPELLVDYLAMT